MKDKNNLHAGHRERLRKRYMKNGISSFEEHQILELLLTYCIHRKDTNELAHNLINNFGSLVNVLSTDANILKQIPGIGETTATFLALIGDIRNKYIDTSARPKNFEYARDVIEHCKTIFMNKSSEEMYMICLDNNMFHVNTLLLSTGDLDFAVLSRRDAISMALNNRAHTVIIAHNHPRTSSMPSFTDNEFTKQFLVQMYNCGVNVTDHIIIGNDNSFYSYKQSGELDKLMKLLNLKTIY